MNAMSFAGPCISRYSKLVPLLALLSVLILLPPDAEAQLLAPAAGAHSVTLTWTSPGDDGTVGTAAEYDIRYSTSPIDDANFSQATPVSGIPDPQPAGSIETLTVDNLQPSTTYYFAIKSADEVPNWSLISNIVSVATSPEEDAPADVADLQAIDPTDTSVTLTWTATGDDGSSGTAAEYDIRYSTSPIDEGNWDEATQVTGEPSPQSAGSAETMTVYGLQQEVTYYFAMKVADEVPNWSGLSNVANSTTLDLTPPAQIDDLEASTGENEGELDVTWTAVGDDDGSGTATAYIVKASTDSITEENWDELVVLSDPPTPLGSGSPQTWTISGLNPGTWYFVGVKAVDEAGNASALSNVASGEARVNLALDIDDDEAADLPCEFGLSQNYPNPFNPTTAIAYALPKATHVRLSVFDIRGRLTTTLVDQQQSPGRYSVTWDARDARGARVASGVYFYRIQTETNVSTKKMILVK